MPYKIHAFFRRYGNPLLIMMCGLPGSGKTTCAEHIIVFPSSYETLLAYTPIVHSSDKLREELYGNEETHGDNRKLFAEMHRRIKKDLVDGKDVVYDATNVKRKDRVRFLNEIKDIKCTPICVVVATEYERCVQNNSERGRVVPEDVIKRMQRNWVPPHYGEGFKEIHYIFSNEPGDEYRLGQYFDVANSFDQENEHHMLTLGEHSVKATTYIQERCPYDYNLLFAAMLHDNGKLHTKTRVNAKGIDDGNCHYYNHHCVGAYNSLFYMRYAGDFTTDDMVEISNLIYYHMHPYNQWKSEKAYERDKRMLGDEMIRKVKLLHKADLWAH